MDGIDLIAAAKRRLRQEGKKDTDYRLAKELGWQAGRLSVLGRGFNCMTDRETVEIARFAGIDEVFALVSISAQRAREKGDDTTPLWEAAATLVSPDRSAA